MASHDLAKFQLFSLHDSLGDIDGITSLGVITLSSFHLQFSLLYLIV